MEHKQTHFSLEKKGMTDYASAMKTFLDNITVKNSTKNIGGDYPKLADSG